MGLVGQGCVLATSNTAFLSLHGGIDLGVAGVGASFTTRPARGSTACPRTGSTRGTAHWTADVSWAAQVASGLGLGDPEAVGFRLGHDLGDLSVRARLCALPPWRGVLCLFSNLSDRSSG